MIKAAALYIVVIVSLLIAIVSGSLLTIAFYYRTEMQKKMRTEKLSQNLESGIAILLSKDRKISDQEELKDLYGDLKDSVWLSKTQWGVFELNIVKAFEVKDSLKRAFLSGSSFTDPSAIYLADEDRPLSVSGKTQITGDGELPKAGLKQAYVDGKAYEGKESIKGKIKDSTRDLPALDEKLIQTTIENFKRTDGVPLPRKDSIGNSFFNETGVYRIKASQRKIESIKLTGKIVLLSDTIVIISSDVVLQDVRVYAPSIVVENGFKGSCQLFARDSIAIGKHCDFKYPSFAGVFKSDSAHVRSQSIVKLGDSSCFSGILFSYEKSRSKRQTAISLGKDCKIKGQVFASGYIELAKPVSIQGKVYATRFITKTRSTLYENYLIDVQLNRKSLSKYYLSSSLFKTVASDNYVLKWLP